MWDKELFAKRLKKLRTNQCLTQSQLADVLGVSRGAISYYENLERTPDIEFLVAASDYFKVDPGFLLGHNRGDKKERREIGFRLGLSDKAIEKMEADVMIGPYVSELVENFYVREFWEVCIRLLKGGQQHE